MCLLIWIVSGMCPQQMYVESNVYKAFAPLIVDASFSATMAVLDDHQVGRL